MILKLHDVALRDGIIFRTQADPRGSQTRQFVAGPDVSIDFDSVAGLVSIKSERHKQMRFVPLSNILSMTPAVEAPAVPVTEFPKKK